jgi:hypothetical protein
MELFETGHKYSEKLAKFKSVNLIFTPLEISTCSVDGHISGLKFDVEGIIDMLSCTGNITNIDCNYGHLTNPDFPEPVKVKKSNRGRKKKERVKKQRKIQGDGSCFNSQITFSVIGTHNRKIPLLKGNTRDYIVKKLDDETESITKKYKIKIFCNGSVTIPGILTEDMSDVKGPLEEVRKYLSTVMLTDFPLDYLRPDMKNYKFKTLGSSIDIRKLCSYFSSKFTSLINTSFSDIVEYLSNPAFVDHDQSPIFDGWNSFMMSKNYSRILNLDEMHRFLVNSENKKNLYVNMEKLKDKIQKMPLKKIYANVQNLFEVFSEKCIFLQNAAYKSIAKFLLIPQTSKLQKILNSSKNNMLSYIKFDSENYQGFLIYIKTPTTKKINKTTTIKIFAGGKINIDGANSREEADYIYHWINYVFVTNKDIIYDENNFYKSDDEFSSDSDD